MNQQQVESYPLTYDSDSPGLESVLQLFQLLNETGIRYVHWKSNIRLDLSLRGGTDLDLLVDREQSQYFRKILLQQDIKPVTPPAGQRYPAMEHYMGFDPDSGKLFHLHVHYQLILGEEYIKNFRLPLEKEFLGKFRSVHGVNIPDPELEIIVLAMRVLLKYRDRDALKDILTIRSPGIKKYFKQELEWLLAQTSMEQITQTLETLAGILPGEIILDFLRTIQTSPRDGWKLASLRGKLRRALSQYQRREPLQAAAVYFLQLWQRRKSFARVSPTSRMTLPGGGLSIALIGVDGAGKSTLVKELAGWLSWKLDVHSYYLGSKQPGLMSDLSYLTFRMLRRNHMLLSHVFRESHAFNRWLASARQHALYWHHLSNGRDRYERYRNGVKKSAAGSIVIFDRFPVSTIAADMHADHLDGPQIEKIAAMTGDTRAQSMIRAEDNIYRSFQAPDALILLMVSPQVSLQRKPDHRPEAIEAKYHTLSQLSERADVHDSSSAVYPSTRIIQINAEEPLETVLMRIKREVWNLI